jgi:hypothetical protein
VCKHLKRHSFWNGWSILVGIIICCIHFWSVWLARSRDERETEERSIRERGNFFRLEEQRNRRERHNFDGTHAFVLLFRFAKKEERKHHNMFYSYSALLSHAHHVEEKWYPVILCTILLWTVSGLLAEAVFHFERTVAYFYLLFMLVCEWVDVEILLT